MVSSTKPKAKIRRFDVFAEYTRLEQRKSGAPADESKGYAIWLAKVVAARKFGRLKPERGKAGALTEDERAERAARKFRVLSGIEQTDEVFDHDIVRRMGKTFYSKVFAPAIRKAFESGKTYKQIRDEIRKQWQVAGTRKP
jgi:hypothetical protein